MSTGLIYQDHREDFLFEMVKVLQEPGYVQFSQSHVGEGNRLKLSLTIILTQFALIFLLCIQLHHQPLDLTMSHI